ncbi:J domain-containing protein [Agrobacterium sp. SHOUNA12C]|uniref:J domain-containing protein n=1 Tax=Rhizobium rhizogenes NBRC 13257 TaxID=1220581 RepID=A0AA87Q7P8_RHIRH|nr:MULTISPECIES: J domain-containing protein [Rhizobium]MCJ9720473.1 J domain-containing protein [Agrobacterium sp. BETTINA12B]MCJ9757196.1 J domain-containing protein [Agrobacterium sp. SHOUNA12C]EJK81605.1 DnaJ-class molecular chaperone with C-terminal Zn finger domain-containing protein [Rhizobium sp. AP16]NTF51602.1 J domain-containing protein [Rhizobium rhizogenes]NTF58132.1 J domain-containing protein [Rhizobium rhizogenes]
MTDPYDILGVGRDASDEQIKAAYRKRAKGAHPDSGGDAEAFGRLKKAHELLLDPVRRKVFDDTGYDVELTDAVDLQALVAIEKLITDMVLDEREPGTFDPVAHMRASLLEEIRKANFSKSELERHSDRIRLHLDRLGKRPGKDVVGHMLRARIKAIATAIGETDAKIGATERACDMLDGYLYVMDTPMLEDEDGEPEIEWDEAVEARSAAQ